MPTPISVRPSLKGPVHLLLADARRGLADIAAGRTREADGAIGRLQQRRADAAKTSGPKSPGNSTVTSN